MSIFLQQSFDRNSSEHTFYKKIVGEEQFLLVCIYVDDLICMGPSTRMIENFKKNMKKMFEISDLGLMSYFSYFLGLEVKQDQEGIHICQRKYV